MLKDSLRASDYYREAALHGHLNSQFELANLYYDGGVNLKRNYMKSWGKI